MVNEPLGSRVFGLADQRAFARLSGDYNPMHLDEIAARRTQAGAPVVHGMHAVLWALDALGARSFPVERTHSIAVRFAKFMYLDTPIAARLAEETPDALTVELTSDDLVTLTLTLRLGAERLPATGAVSADLPEIAPSATTPDDPSSETLASLSGWLVPPHSGERLADLFPEAARALEPRRLDGLAQLSRLVGMISPGLHSIFSSFTVKLLSGSPDRPGIGFRVTTADARFRIAKMEFAGSGLEGTVTAFMRQPPVETPSLEHLASQVTPGEFDGTTSLVVGASRGLGAITAKLLAAGGGRVLLTYARGRDDAERLVSEINAVHGAEASTALPLDVRGDIAPQLAGAAGPISHLYYFATPQIFRQRSGVFTGAHHEEFSRFYVSAFAETVAALLAREGKEPLGVFYPSSIAVEERPAGMTEYAMAKAAGEILCVDLAQAMPRLTIAAERLPRTLTDQTATVGGTGAADAATVMLPLIRKLQREARDRARGPSRRAAG